VEHAGGCWWTVLGAQFRGCSEDMGADVSSRFLEAASDRKPSSIVDVIGLSFAILQPTRPGMAAQGTPSS